MPIGDEVGCLTREYLDPEAGLAEYLTQKPADKSAHLRISIMTKYLRRDEFLKFPVVICRGEKATVLDMIKHYAYTTGALHGGAADPAGLISRLPTYNKTADEKLDPVEQTIVGIGRVIVRALRPLVLAIEANYRPRRGGDAWIEVDEETSRLLLELD